MAAMSVMVSEGKTMAFDGMEVDSDKGGAEVRERDTRV